MWVGRMNDVLDAVRNSWLLCRAGAHFCALPLGQIIEVMRVLPAEPLAGAPPFLKGVAVIRGAPVPLVDLARLLGQAEAPAARIVTLRVGPRVLGLLVAEVAGIKRDAEIRERSMVPLLRQAAGKAVEMVGALDEEVLLFLGSLRIVAESVPA